MGERRLTDPKEASAQFSTLTTTIGNLPYKEFRGLKPFGAIGTPIIVTRSASNEFEANFGYYGSKLKENVRMERLSRKGNTAVYTQCTAAGCTTVTPDICKSIQKETSNSNYQKLLECSNLLTKVGKHFDSDKLKALTETEIASFNPTVPSDARINLKDSFMSAEAADSRLSKAIKNTATLISNCQKLEKTTFPSLVSPIETNQAAAVPKQPEAKR